MEEFAKLLADRFQGREDYYAVQQPDGSYRPQAGTLTPAILKRHLDGALTLGVYVLRKEGHGDTCTFGTIDWDLPSYAHWEALQQAVSYASRLLKHFDLDHLVEHSGRKGYHLWVFFAVPVPALLVQQFLQSVAAQMEAELGYPCPVEIFPKQTQLTETCPYGNLVKVPWGKHRVTGNRAYLVDEELCVPEDPQWQLARMRDVRRLTEVEIREFLDEYPAPEKAVRLRKADLSEEKGLLFGRGQVPCTPKLLQLPAVEGKGDRQSRNHRLFDLAVRFYREGELEEQALKHLRVYNEAKCQPVMPDHEVVAILRSVYQKGYAGLNCEKLAYVCAGAECPIYCATHGITPEPVKAAMEDDCPLAVTDLVKINTDPPIYRARIAGCAMQFVGDELMRYTVFRSKVFQAINKIHQIPRAPKQSAQSAWEDYLAPLLDTCVEEDAPEEASEMGRLKQIITDWAEVNGTRTERRELLLQTKACLALAAYPQSVVFRFETLRNYIERHRLGDWKQHELWNALRQLQAESTPIRLEDGKLLRCVVLPVVELKEDSEGNDPEETDATGEA